MKPKVIFKDLWNRGFGKLLVEAILIILGVETLVFSAFFLFKVWLEYKT